MSEEQLREIEARIQAATPGPWDCDYFDPDRPQMDDWHILAPDAPNGELVYVVGHDEDLSGPTGLTRDNAVFIANAPADITALLAEVRRLQQRQGGA